MLAFVLTRLSTRWPGLDRRLAGSSIIPSFHIQKLIGSEVDEEDMETDIKEQNDVSGGKSMETPVIVNVDGAITSDGSISDNQLQHEQCSTQGGARTGRPQEEKERTKLRERQRRAITARILAGLRRHGNYNLRVRADINDVIAALAREAGWVVLPDGTTFPSKSQGSKAAGCSSNMVATTSTSRMVPPQTPAAPLRGVSSSYRSLLEDNACHVKDFDAPTSSPYDSTSSRSHSTDMLGDELAQTENHPLVGNSMPMVAVSSNKEHDYSGTAYVPVYVMLPLGVVNMKSEVADPDGLLNQLRLLKSVDVDGVMVDCWWGIVEARTPQEYNWNGYRMLFQIVHELKFKLQVVMSFHECGGNIGDDVCIPLPHWVAEIGRSNLDIFFADREGRHNPECLSWGIDRERVLGGRTAIEVYFDFMRSFRVEFDDLFEAGIISMVELGLGPCGELRYPSYPVKHGWRYPGIGEFQCYDQYLLRSLRKAAEARGHPFWARGPDNAGSYNSRSHETGFFCDGGDYDGYYGRFFLNWYSQVLVDHADQILSLAKLVFEGTCIAAKLSGIYWWYKTASHAAELTAGFYNSSNRDGYAAIMTVLKKHGAAVNLTWAELQTLQLHEDFTESLADPEGLIWQVLNAAWDAGTPVTSENSVPCNDRESYNRILENAKPYNDPDGRHFAAFTYLRLSPILMERHNFIEFERFIKRMHGEVVVDLQ